LDAREVGVTRGRRREARGRETRGRESGEMVGRMGKVAMKMGYMVRGEESNDPH